MGGQNPCLGKMARLSAVNAFENKDITAGLLEVKSSMNIRLHVIIPALAEYFPCFLFHYCNEASGLTHPAFLRDEWSLRI